MSISTADLRASAPILTFREASRLIGMDSSEKLRSWTRPSEGKPPLVHSHKARKRGWPTLPLVGLAEGFSLNALREMGMSMQQARIAARYIREESGDQFAMANPQFVTDGTDAFLQSEDELIRIRDQQGAFKEVLRGHLAPLLFGSDGYVERFVVAEDPLIVVDPRFNGGRPSFADTLVPVFPILGALEAGDPPEIVALDFDIESSKVGFIDEQRERFSLIA